jgi:hypothetical protein
MSHYHLPAICLMALSIVCTASSQQLKTNDWHPDTRKLDDTAKFHDPSDTRSKLARDVKRFYQLLRDKQWHETYEQRAKAFREDIPETDYLVKAKKAEKLWGLLNYDVLSIQFLGDYGATNYDEAMLICRFTEVPNYEVSYSTVFWHYEDGVWKCMSAGPCKLDIFEGTRPPFIDWR